MVKQFWTILSFELGEDNFFPLSHVLYIMTNHILTLDNIVCNCELCLRKILRINSVLALICIIHFISWRY